MTLVIKSRPLAKHFGSGITTRRALKTALDVSLATAASGYLLFSLTNAASAAPEMAPVLIGFFSCGLGAVLGMYVSLRRSHTLPFVVFYYIFCFDALAPVQQIGARYDEIFFDGTIVYTALLMVVIFTLTALVLLLSSFSARSKLPKTWDRSILEIESPNTLLLIVASCVCSAILIWFYGAELFTTRSGRVDLIMDDANKTSLIIVGGLLEPFALVSAVVGISLCWRSRDLSGLAFILPLVVAIAIDNPFAQARFRSSSLILFVMLLWFGYGATRLVAGLLFSGIAASPIYNSYFRYGINGADNRETMRFFVHMDYEAVNLFCYGVKWTQQVGYTFGSNLLGAFFFFIPRSIWPDKGEHPAAIIFDLIKTGRDTTTENLSSPPDMEGFLSFGIVGGIFLIVTTLVLIFYLDRRAAKAAPMSTWALFGSMSPILILLLLRGPLQVGFSELVMHLASVWLCIAILKANFRTNLSGPVRRRRVLYRI